MRRRKNLIRFSVPEFESSSDEFLGMGGVLVLPVGRVLQVNTVCRLWVFSGRDDGSVVL